MAMDTESTEIGFERSLGITYALWIAVNGAEAALCGSVEFLKETIRMTSQFLYPM